MSATLSKTQSAVAAFALFAAMLGLQAAAQTYTVGAGSAPFNVVASGASGDTEFTISASGTVTKVSGQGGRVSTGSANATVTVACGNQNACNTANVNVKVGSAGSPTNRAKAITAFNVASGTATVSNISGSNPITFRLTPIGKSSSKTFKLGMTFKVKGDDSGSPVGSAATAYYVSVAAAPTTPPSSGTNGAVNMTVYRSLSVSKGSDLSFGRVVKPLTGTGLITLNPNGTRSATGGAVWLNSPFPIRASYTATGDGGKVLAVTVQSSFAMNRTGGGGSLTVNTNNSISGTPMLSAGASGTYSFFVGGSFSLPSSTPSGSYSGTFNTTVAYN